MKEQLYAVISEETGNCIAICCNVDDAINISVNYEMKKQTRFLIEDVSKYGAAELLKKQWVKQEPEVIAIHQSKPVD